MSGERKGRAQRYAYTPRRSEKRPSLAERGSIIRPLVLFTAVTGITLFGAAEATGVFHIEDVPSAVVKGVQSAIEKLPEERDYQGRGEYYNTPVEPGVEKQFLTEDWGQGEIPVRSEPGPGDQVGITLRTFLVDGQEWWGVAYPSDSTVGHIEGPDGETYGLWFKADVVPLFAKTEDGEYVPIGVVHGAFIAQNFLTLPQETDN